MIPTPLTVNQIPPLNDDLQKNPVTRMMMHRSNPTGVFKIMDETGEHELYLLENTVVEGILFVAIDHTLHLILSPEISDIVLGPE